jgi:hypothetical protein
MTSGWSFLYENCMRLRLERRFMYLLYFRDFDPSETIWSQFGHRTKKPPPPLYSFSSNLTSRSAKSLDLRDGIDLIYLHIDITIPGESHIQDVSIPLCYAMGCDNIVSIEFCYSSKLFPHFSWRNGHKWLQVGVLKTLKYIMMLLQAPSYQ